LLQRKCIRYAIDTLGNRKKEEQVKRNKDRAYTSLYSAVNFIACTKHEIHSFDNYEEMDYM